MQASVMSICLYSDPKPSLFHHLQLNSNSRKLVNRPKSIAIRCCHREAKGKPRKTENYYEVLGVCAGSSPREIKEAYRNLQKKHHPDIAGQKGHEHTLLLNQAYKVLMTEDLRREYNASIGFTDVRFGEGASSMGYSSWNGPLRPQALFVDENACIGCRECVHHASNTFTMDETLGCARVRLQYGDDDTKIMVSVDSCPISCIHWVETEELAVLEYVMRPRRKEGYGIFGHGWERPKNVFMAAKALKKQLKQQAENDQTNARKTGVEETPAQAHARENASFKMKMESFLRIWNLGKNLGGK